MSSPTRRRSSPRRRYNPSYHQMGDHTLFHNGTTARMFPALTKLQPAELSQMFHVPEADKTAERYDEIRFAEPFDDRPTQFRSLDSPVRDEQQNKIIARGGIVSTSFTNSHNMNGTNGSSHAQQQQHRSSNGTSNTSRPATSNIAAARPSSSTQLPSRDSLKHYQLVRPTTGNSVYSSSTIRLHGNQQFKVTNVSTAKDALRNTIPSINIGFDVEETLRQAHNAEAKEHYYKQCVISSTPIKGYSSAAATSPTAVGAAALPSSSSRSGSATRSGSSNSANNNQTTKQRGKGNVPAPPPPPPERLVFKPFSRGTELEARQRLDTNWYLNNGPSAALLQSAIDKLKEENKISRENRRVARQRYDM